LGFCYEYGYTANTVNGFPALYIARHSFDNPFKPWSFYANNKWIDSVHVNRPSISLAAGHEAQSVCRLKGYTVLFTKKTNTSAEAGDYCTIAAEAYGPFNTINFINKQTDDKINIGAFSAFPNYINASNEILCSSFTNGLKSNLNCANNETMIKYFQTTLMRLPLKSIKASW
jgi:hypothetical protein